MRSTATGSNTLETRVAALKNGTFDGAAAQRLYQLGPHAVTLALLAAARRIAEQDARLTLLERQAQAAGGGGPGTPSGMRPIYTRPNVAAGGERRRKHPGARVGQPGHHRAYDPP